jgi:hypothetical protein
MCTDHPVRELAAHLHTCRQCFGACVAFVHTLGVFFESVPNTLPRRFATPVKTCHEHWRCHFTSAVETHWVAYEIQSFARYRTPSTAIFIVPSVAQYRTRALQTSIEPAFCPRGT